MGGGLTKQGLAADGDGMFTLKFTGADMVALAGYETAAGTLAAVCARSGAVLPDKAGGQEHGAAAKLQAKQRQKLAKEQLSTEVSNDALAAVFFAFCAYGKRGGAVTVLEGKQFAKMMKECKILNKKFNGNGADILFSKVAKKSKTITKDQFFEAIELVGGETGKGVDWVKKNLVVNGVPQSSGTKAEANKFYDDKSTWTATANAGGPTNVDQDNSLSALADRDNKADVRGVMQSGGGGGGAANLRFKSEELDALQTHNNGAEGFEAFMAAIIAQSGPASSSTPAAAPAGGDKESDAAAAKMQAIQRKRATKVQMSTEVNDDTLDAVFFAFCAYGKRGAAVTVMEGKQFVKMMKECKIFNKKFNSNGADILFSKVAKKSKTITKAQWHEAIELVGAESGKGVDWVKKNLVVNGVPQSSGTKAEANKFYDDKSKWTATANAGGPTNVDAKTDLASQANRDNKADVRGVVS